MTPKSKRIISTILMTITCSMVAVGGIMKLLDAEPQMVVEFLTEAGFGNYIKILGIAQLMLVLLLVYPKTNKVGFLLASCYFGGALCLEIGAAQFPVSAIVLTFLWVAMFLIKREMFLPLTFQDSKQQD